MSTISSTGIIRWQTRESYLACSCDKIGGLAGQARPWAGLGLGVRHYHSRIGLVKRLEPLYEVLKRDLKRGGRRLDRRMASGVTRRSTQVVLVSV